MYLAFVCLFQVKEKVMREARQIYRDIASQLVDHLRNKDTQKNIFRWHEGKQHAFYSFASSLSFLQTLLALKSTKSAIFY